MRTAGDVGRIGGGNAASSRALAGEPGLDMPVDDERWSVPPSLQAMLQPLEALRRPSGALYRLYTDAHAASAELPTDYRYGPNRIVLDGAPVDVGFSIDLTIDPALQALAQKTAACYTGRQDVCRALGIQRAEDRGRTIGHRLLEGAMVRMAAVAVIDVASGRIEALAGALSPCARQEVDGPGRGANCDKRLPYPVQYRPDALLNPAVFHDAMPASTIKPIMAAAFLSDRDVGARWLAAERAAMKRSAAPARDSLRGQLMRSDSARFLDRMFCVDKGFADCARPWDVQAAARGVRLERRLRRSARRLRQARPAVRPRGRCDRGVGLRAAARDDRGLRPADERAGRRQARRAAAADAARALDPAIVRRCAAGADGRRLSDDDWEKCRGGAVVDVVAEGWGQGHARASALGVAGMMATLAAAANGQTEVRRPHLVESVRGVGRAMRPTLRSAVVRWSLAPAQPNRAVARRGRGDPERPVVQPSRRHRAHRLRAGVRCDDAAATSTGSPARPARRAFRATGSRSTSWRGCAGRRRGDARQLQPLAARCGPTSGTWRPIATDPQSAARGPRRSPC